ncbi:MAG: methylated-DNA--[protein]-cysteine S-methyltransferase [Corallococcus sp.]|nr:methylated-DNA--[protein]-cysteine S-methyltransferase [Corallococcus sp.]MCM1359192.1 methylated-DNA--[protein]-cysteine S-methyltransferase [Corallococcus sp.]MCM1394582.1 methylated-DNA--[protein]-cysteine S-methyltransferase [Corallococcus sp.]
MKHFNKYQSPLGELIMAADENGLAGLWFSREKRCTELFVERGYVTADLPIFCDVKRWLDVYFDGKNPNFDLPLSFYGTEFQKTVWKILCGIPYGQTMTYGDIAKILARERGITKMSAQAVGGAVGSNDISIIVPCHRVMGANGNLTGYAAGLDKKIALLKLEGAFDDNFYVPKSKLE